MNDKEKIQYYKAQAEHYVELYMQEKSFSEFLENKLFELRRVMLTREIENESKDWTGYNPLKEAERLILEDYNDKEET